MVALVANRFGAIDPTLQNRIDEADESQLQTAIQHILEAESPDELITDFD